MISLIHPSRSRAEKSFKNSTEWIQKAGCDVELIVSIDLDDPNKMDYLNKYIDSKCTIICEQNSCVVEATNKAATQATGDILVYLSDDFKCFDNWGLAVQKEFEGVSRPLLLKVDDCLQDFNVAVLTIPIMNRWLYEGLKYFWHNDYKSMFCDEDLYWTAKKVNALKLTSHLKFPHEHPANGKAPNDEVYNRSAANWDQGKAAFAKRKALGFPL